MTRHVICWRAPKRSVHELRFVLRRCQQSPGPNVSEFFVVLGALGSGLFRYEAQ
jgi:hypothetical protein